MSASPREMKEKEIKRKRKRGRRGRRRKGQTEIGNEVPKKEMANY